MNKIKNILSKLRPDRTDSKQAKTVERIAAIGHSSDAVGWRPVSYTIPDRFNQFISHLDSDIESFISQSNPDRYNALFFEGTVNAEVKLAVKELAVQLTDHKRSIHNIRLYQTASLKNLETNLQRMEEAYAKNKEGK